MMSKSSMSSIIDQDYTDYSFPNTPTAIVLEKVKDTDFVLPTVPSQTQLQSIQSGEIMPLPSSKKNKIVSPAITYAASSPPPPPPSKLPFITTVYIGSLTVVGLFLLFRMIQK